MTRLASDLLNSWGTMRYFYPHKGLLNAKEGRLRLIVALIFLTGGIIACTDSPQPPLQTVEIFPLAQLNQDNNLERVPVDFKGKILLINFWATWCAPCRKEMPALQNLSATLDTMRYAVIGVSVDSDINLVKEFLIQYKIQYPNFLDKSRYIASSLLKIEAYPETIIVSPEGTILKRISGIISPNDKRLKQLLDLTDTIESAVLESNNPGLSL